MYGNKSRTISKFVRNYLEAVDVFTGRNVRIPFRNKKKPNMNVLIVTNSHNELATRIRKRQSTLFGTS